MVDRNVSKTLVGISLWTFKKKKTLFLIVLHGFLLTLNFLWAFALLVAHVLQCQCIAVCLHMNLRPIFARHLKFGFVILRELNLV